MAVDNGIFERALQRSVEDQLAAEIDSVSVELFLEFGNCSR